MRAFILAGGLGTRLRARFGDLPKPLAPIGGRPFLALQLEWLERSGIREAVICAGHGAAELRAALGDGRVAGVGRTWAGEPAPLGTGGALRLAAPWVRGPALVANGDTLLACDPWALERARWEAGAVGAVALCRVEDAASRGRVEVDGAGRVTRFVEKDAAHRGPAWVNAGLYAFSPRLWRRMPAPETAGAPAPLSLERDLLPGLAAESALVGLAVEGEFYDIGTPEEWARAERRFGT